MTLITSFSLQWHFQLLFAEPSHDHHLPVPRQTDLDKKNEKNQRLLAGHPHDDHLTKNKKSQQTRTTKTTQYSETLGCPPPHDVRCFQLSSLKFLGFLPPRHPSRLLENRVFVFSRLFWFLSPRHQSSLLEQCLLHTFHSNTVLHFIADVSRERKTMIL